MQLSNERLVELVQNNIYPIEHLEALYTQNKGLMTTLILKVFPNGVNTELMEELLQECYIILCDTVKNFDLKQDNKFNTYLGNAIRWGMYKYTLLNGIKIKIPINMLGKVNKYKKLYATGETESNIARALAISTSELKSIKNIAQSSVISLDTPLKNLDNVTVGESIPDNNSNFEDDVINRVDEGILYNLCKSILKPYEFEVVKFTYWYSLTQKEIGKKIGKSKGMVDNLKRSALARLGQDQRIKNYYEPYLYRHTGINEFKRTHTSSVEKYVLLKAEIEDLRKSLIG